MNSTNSFLPVSNPTNPFWRTELHELDEHRSTPELPKSSDIVIIGAGYAGVSIAYHLLKPDGSQNEPKPSITVLEARQVCSGATGRNGGHARPDLIDRIPNYIKRHGLQAAGEVANFEVDHIKAFKDLSAREGIDYDFTVTRSMSVYTSEKTAAQAKETYDEMIALGLPFFDDLHYTPGKHAEGVSGVKGAKACLSYTAASLWPYKLVSSLLSKVMETGAVNLQTSTPVTSVTSKGPDGHSVNTPRGSIQARKVVYATNGYSIGLLPEYAASIIPCKGICCHIDVPEGRNPPFLPYSYITDDGDGTKHGSYLISRPDGSIIVGGGRETFWDDRGLWYRVVDDSTLIAPAKTYYDKFMQRTFRGWEESGAFVKEIWTGIMGYSYDSRPHVGGIPGRPGQYICAGFDGHGMPVVYLAAKGLAEMIGAGKEFEEVNLPRLYKSTWERLDAARNGKEGGNILN